MIDIAIQMLKGKEAIVSEDIPMTFVRSNIQRRITQYFGYI